MLITVVFALACSGLVMAMLIQLLSYRAGKIYKSAVTTVCGAIIVFAVGCIGSPVITYQNGGIVSCQGSKCQIELEDGKTVETYSVELKNEGTSGIRITARPIMYGTQYTHSYTAVIVPKTE